MTKNHPIRHLLTLAVILALTVLATSRCLALEAKLDQTEAPYFEVKGGESFPLESTEVEVEIAGVIADVTLKQVYRNRGATPLEAKYVFPASTRAAVHGMTMKISDRVILAQIQEKQQAKETFEKAKDEGKTASLLEEHRPNVFQMSVANILPGDRVEVILQYTEMLVPTDQIYEFVLPTVVGPRYEGAPGQTGASGEKWVHNPYLTVPQQAMTVSSQPAFTFQARIDGGMPLSDVTSPSHPVDIQYDGQTSCTVGLQPGGSRPDNRDLILRYRLAGEMVNTGLLLHRGEKENFFALMLQPPARTELAQIPPRDYVFVVDVSGSMRGFPLDVSKTLLRDLISSLRPTDTFNVMLFAGGSRVLSPTPLTATEGHIRRAVRFLANEHGGGGTELLPAMRRALALPKSEDTSRSVIIATDGYVSVETEAFDLVRENVNQLNVFAFGIGSSVNRHLIEGLARVGQGEAFVALNPLEAKSVAKRFRQYVEHPVLTQAKLIFDGFEVYDLEPPVPADVLANRPVTVVGKWRGEPTGTITLEGQTGEGPYQRTIQVADYAGLENVQPLPYLWARERIRTLVDYNQLFPKDERVAEATNLGLLYNLLTPYTSFVAVDKVVRNPGGQSEEADQPLPLPKGVSPSAISSGGSAVQIGVVPEPEAWGMLLMVAGIAAWVHYQRRRKARASTPA